MSKIIDITSKLNFEEKPVFKIKDVKVTANNDAITMLKVIALFDGENDEFGSKEIVELFNLLFDESEQVKLRDLNMSFNDLAIFVNLVADEIINSGEETKGETPTPAMT